MDKITLVDALEAEADVIREDYKDDDERKREVVELVAEFADRLAARLAL